MQGRATRLGADVRGRVPRWQRVMLATALSGLPPYEVPPVPLRLQSELQYMNGRREAAEAELVGSRAEAARQLQGRDESVAKVCGWTIPWPSSDHIP